MKLTNSKPNFDYSIIEDDGFTRIAIPYLEDSTNYASRLNHLPYFIWLDSAAHKGFKDGDYDILSAIPSKTLKTIGQTTTIKPLTGNSEGRVEVSNLNPFDLVKQEVNKLPRIENTNLPFTGGALGFFGYHLNKHIEDLPTVKNKDLGLPDMVIGVYDWALIQNHSLRQSELIFLPTVAEKRRKEILTSVSTPPVSDHHKLFEINNLSSNFNVDSYSTIIDKIQDYIRAGDVYQVNVAQRFQAQYSGEPFDAYRKLRRILPAPYSAFFSFEEGSVLSFSPELFLQVNSSAVCTKPIKGTRPRNKNPAIDKAEGEALSNSAKDKAENLMIVDLLRNDLGKHCLPGSVSVPNLFELYSFENVHHLVSTVTGSLKASSSPLDLLRDSFPGGSITGAPKIRAMEIINELEEQERSTYCGSVGYISTNGNLLTNIAIRTLVTNKSQKTITAWGGGGIVADSDAASEYQECLDKIDILLKGLQSPT